MYRFAFNKKLGYCKATYISRSALSKKALFVSALSALWELLWTEKVISDFSKTIAFVEVKGRSHIIKEARVNRWFLIFAEIFRRKRSAFIVSKQSMIFLNEKQRMFYNFLRNNNMRICVI